MNQIKWPWWQRFWRHPHFLAQHMNTLLMSALVLSLLIGVNAWLGEAKGAIDWVDVIGETLTAVCFALLLVVLCYLRPNNTTTRWMTLGVLWLVLAHSQDALDEWWSVSDQYWFTSVIESLPIGWLLLAIGISRWLTVHWKTLRLLQSYQFEPEAPMDSSTGLPTWPLLLAKHKQSPRQRLLIVHFTRSMPEWSVLALRDQLPKYSILVSLSSNRLAVACNEAVILEPWLTLLAQFNLPVQVSEQVLTNTSPQQALWQAESELSYG
ncbi:hypothetical protein [Salinibius halmophilus]|uniref:hypothetical protein n=1 Tax=Salinibius halmophilus TaxID=1853216 RepID=UPI000E66DB82|nr:hypothetical protein [Salinibius halmophilus]